MTLGKSRQAAFEAALAERILVMDGAMGTMIQTYQLEKRDYEGARFRRYHMDLKGNNDVLNLTQPEIIGEIHGHYFAAGADMVSTNTFNANAISQADYDLAELAYEINHAGAEIARAAADAAENETPGRTCFVVGSLGPTNRTASVSPDVSNPGYRNTNFDELAKVYTEAARGLIDGGADLLLFETVFDTLNVKAGLYGVEALFDELGERLPLLVLGTVTDLSGRNLSGQTSEAFWLSVRHVEPLAVGMNCAFGAAQMRAYIDDLSSVVDTYIAAWPNAGLPNEFGEYDESPEATAAQLGEWAEAGLLNIVGGCCGTTPAHIRAIADAVAGVVPRERPTRPARLRLSGLEPFEVRQ
jgi:5-methyltetrahydrofolate--homocysteine methyltransferase